MYCGMTFPKLYKSPYLHQKKNFTSGPFFCLHNVFLVTGTILHCNQIADLLSEHNFTNLDILDFKPAQLMSFGIK